MMLPLGGVACNLLVMLWRKLLSEVPPESPSALSRSAKLLSRFVLVDDELELPEVLESLAAAVSVEDVLDSEAESDWTNLVRSPSRRPPGGGGRFAAVAAEEAVAAATADAEVTLSLSVLLSVVEFNVLSECKAVNRFCRKLFSAASTFCVDVVPSVDEVDTVLDVAVSASRDANASLIAPIKSPPPP